MHSTLHLRVFFSFSFFGQPYPKYWWILSKKIKHLMQFHRTANAIKLLVPIKRKFFGSLLFQNKLQRRGIPQGLLDKWSHLFIWISLKWTLSSGQKPECIVKILISEQIAFAAVLYFGQVFVFCRLINKRMLEWFPLMSK